jgi:hypothetical protein
MVARYTSGQDNQYFAWNDALQDDARTRGAVNFGLVNIIGAV